MCIAVLYLSLLLHSGLAVVVLQSDEQISLPGGRVTLECQMGPGVDMTSYTMLWYRQQQYRAPLEFLATEYDQNTGHLQASIDRSTKRFYLHITELFANDSSMYYCAAVGQSPYEPAYFGGGTKLTVLESSVVPPTVNVLKPSTKECRNSKDDARRKTIVCVASNFYPDHVSVKWQVGGTDVTRGVVTGTAQRKKGETSYKITSRLTVSAENWNTGGHEFKCIVSFFDGNITMYFNDTVYGEATTTSVLTREKYLKITQTAKLAYAVFIIKSAIYGIFIAYLVWRIQGSFGKLSN